MSNNPAVQALVDVVEKRAAEYTKAYEHVKALRKEMREAATMATNVANVLGEDAPEYSETVKTALAARRRNKDGDDEPEANESE